VRVEAEADPKRLLRLTEAAKHAQEHARLERQRAQLMPSTGVPHGYDDKTIMGDVRHKVMHALRQAGLEVSRKGKRHVFLCTALEPFFFHFHGRAHLPC
jgi:hypothetical protein